MDNKIDDKMDDKIVDLSEQAEATKDAEAVRDSKVSSGADAIRDSKVSSGAEADRELSRSLGTLKARLESSEEFNIWKKDNPGFYLAHMFLMTGHEPQLGYYNKETDTVVTFDISERITVNPASEVFKESGIIEELSVDGVVLGTDAADTIARDVMDREYPGQAIDKEIVILQVLSGIAVYNITFITKSFCTINIRVNAKTKEVISHEKRSIMDLRKADAE
ncbi:hypothetical protein JXB31_00120 [Candidatus Woesearchaeota archaeon]|nr:hypothetical protein [Candidatus Woesearchaeota archaeon]